MNIFINYIYSIVTFLIQTFRVMIYALSWFPFLILLFIFIVFIYIPNLILVFTVVLPIKTVDKIFKSDIEDKFNSSKLAKFINLYMFDKVDSITNSSIIKKIENLPDELYNHQIWKSL